MVRGETNTLALKNVSDCTVAYKVKTTAQKKYLVSPSNGILMAGETVQVSILKQAGYVPAEKEDRFMLLACETRSTEKLSSEEWTAQTNVEDIRLMVVLEASDITLSPIPGKSSNMMDDDRKSDLLQAKYGDLLTYTINLEREKNAADMQLEHLTSTTSSKGKRSGLSLCALLLFMVISAATSRNFHKILELV